MVLGPENKLGLIRDTSIQPFAAKEETIEIPLPDGLRDAVVEAVLDAHGQVRQSWTDILQRTNDALGLDVKQATYQLGPMLRFDPATEKFVDNAEADKLLTRPYREPFVVTEEV